MSEEVSPFDYRLAGERRRIRDEELKTVAGRRYHACHAAREMREVIQNLPESSRKQELLNMANLTLRLVILENDGGPLSPSKLNAF